MRVSLCPQRRLEAQLRRCRRLASFRHWVLQFLPLRVGAAAWVCFPLRRLTLCFPVQLFLTPDAPGTLHEWLGWWACTRATQSSGFTWAYAWPGLNFLAYGLQGIAACGIGALLYAVPSLRRGALFHIKASSAVAAHLVTAAAGGITAACVVRGNNTAVPHFVPDALRERMGNRVWATCGVLASAVAFASTDVLYGSPLVTGAYLSYRLLRIQLRRFVSGVKYATPRYLPWLRFPLFIGMGMLYVAHVHRLGGSLHACWVTVACCVARPRRAMPVGAAIGLKVATISVLELMAKVFHVQGDMVALGVLLWRLIGPAALGISGAAVVSRTTVRVPCAEAAPLLCLREVVTAWAP